MMMRWDVFMNDPFDKQWSISVWLMYSLAFLLLTAAFVRPLRLRPRGKLVCVSVLLFLLATACPFFFTHMYGAPIGFVCQSLAVALFFRSFAGLSGKASLYCMMWVIMCGQFISGAVSLFRRMYILGSLLGRGGGDRMEVVSCVAWLLCLAAVGATIAVWLPENRTYNIGPRQFCAAALSFFVFEVTLSYYGVWTGRELLGDKWQMMLLIEIYCLTLVYLQQEAFKKSAVRRELALFNQMYSQQRQQYRLARENIAVINRKCHDLKHQVQAMRLSISDESREKSLREIEEAVHIYELIVRTGNEVLDTVITEKSLYCESKQIVVHCVADGEALSFVDPIDLYTIFANALDNAIEAVERLGDLEKRLIDVFVFREKQLLMIQIINPIQRNMQTDADGLPVTTKRNRQTHGFGLRSIRHIVEGYGGFLTVSVERDCFYLRILLPVPQ